MHSIFFSYERGKQLADQLGVEFFETSAKENINVKAVFERLVDIICGTQLLLLLYARLS
jgi:hypothetical protein